MEKNLCSFYFSSYSFSGFSNRSQFFDPKIKGAILDQIQTGNQFTNDEAMLGTKVKIRAIVLCFP